MAQSSTPKSPIAVPLFWESDANPNQEWSQWFSTFKIAVMAKENLKVDKLLRTKPTPADLFYPAMPSLEEAKKMSQKKKQERETSETREEKSIGKMSVRQ